MNKNRALWLLKLSALTLAIYWFMSDGFQSSVSQGTGIRTLHTVNEGAGLWVALLAGAYLVFALMRSIYRRNVRRPKSEGFKKFQRMKE